VRQCGGSGFGALALGALAVWRITHLLNAEDGPWDVFVRLRRLAGDGFWAHVLDCFKCLSLWVAAPFALVLATSASECLLLWPALSGAAILLQRTIAPWAVATPQYWHEEDTDGVLRTKQTNPNLEQQGKR